MKNVINVDLAAIDIGTNSVRLIIAELKRPRNLIVKLKETEITRLGQRVDSNREITTEAIDRTADVLLSYQYKVRERNISKVRVVATSALRDALNGQKIVDHFSRLIGFPVEIIDGQEEANLSFNGATSFLKEDIKGQKNLEVLKKPNKLRYLVVDIGGGSTEFICGRAGKPDNVFSLDIGSVRLTERFIRHDPPDPREISKILDFVLQEIGKLWQEIGGIDYILGVAGTFTTLAAINKKMEIYDPVKIHLSKLTGKEIDVITELLSKIKLAFRKKVAGLEPKRADVIIAGSIIARQVLETFNKDWLFVSERDLLDGLILSLL